MQSDSEDDNGYIGGPDKGPDKDKDMSKRSVIKSLDLSAAQSQQLLTSHSKGELWGVAVHPTDPDVYCTLRGYVRYIVC